MIFDTHAHYDDEAFDGDRDLLLRQMTQNDVGGIVNVGASVRGMRESIALSEQYEIVYAGVGIHPDDIADLNDDLLQEMTDLAKREKTVCIGEIGLDYHWMIQPEEVQKEGFVRQLHLARELDLPINVHSRDAAQDTFDIIRSEHAHTTGGIIHCFSGSVEMAREYVKLGYYIGVGGVVTFKNSKTLKKVVQEIPLERIVTETDCPYLAPSPFRGKRNDSTRIRLVIDEIASLRGLDPETAGEQLWKNAREVYRLNRKTGLSGR